MKRGLRYLPAPRRGRRRAALLGVGFIAALSLVWQQQATLASFIDPEYAGAQFTAGTLSAITPDLVASEASIKVDWSKSEPTKKWATPQYQLDWSATGTGNANSLYAGPDTSKTHRDGPNVPNSKSVSFTAVAAGAVHACGISRGDVYCWGTSGTGALGGATSPAKAPSKVSGLPGGATVVAAGTDFSCAIVGGSVYCWGLNGTGQLGSGTVNSSVPLKVSGLPDTVTAITAGGAHACAVADTVAYCWGANGSGQLGDGTTTSPRRAAVSLASAGGLSGRRVASISAGANHTCAVADGQTFCWGLNTSGQLGDASLTARSSPVAVDATDQLMGRTVSAIAAGGSHTCAIADAKLLCWGLGTSGQLGNGANASSSRPVTAGALPAIPTSVVAGLTHSCAIAAGKLYCWGSNVGVATPVAFGGSNRTITWISIGTDFGCMVALGAPAACVGVGTSYQLGNNANPTRTSTFDDVSLQSPTCADGSVRTSNTTCSLTENTRYWYRLDYSIGSWDAPASPWLPKSTGTRSASVPQRKDQTVTSITVDWKTAPEPGNAYPEYQLERAASASDDEATTLGVTGDTSWTDNGGVTPTREFEQVASGDGHSCGIVDGDLYCWGQNLNGQLGIGSTDQKTVPTKVTGLPSGKVTDVTAGTSHTCAIASGVAYCWGFNNSYRLGDGTTTQRTAPVAVAGALANKTVTAISAGAGHTCAIASGQGYCWGLNSAGQVGNNLASAQTPVAVLAGEMPSVNVRGIAAGGAHTCAINSDDNRAYCWGQNDSWQLGSRYCRWEFGEWCLSWTDPQNKDRATPVEVETSGDMATQNVTAITAGALHTCAIAATKAYCWGQAGSGQLGDGSTTDTRLSQAVTDSSMNGVVAKISAGNDHTCAVAGSKAYCWGADASGQLGNGVGSPSTTPVAITANGALSTATGTSIAAGAGHTCAVADNNVYCWGANTTGQLGNRTTTNSTAAVRVVSGVRCAAGATALGNGLCSLVPDTAYRYRLTYTLDGTTKKVSDWAPLKTG